MALKVSIVLIAERWNLFLEESINHILQLDYSNYDVFVFSFEKIDKRYKRTKFIFDRNLKNKPAQRRDLIIQYSNSDIYAFIDDDAFPHPKWLKRAIPHFKNQQVMAVTGPGLNPPDSPLKEQVSGWISASPFVGYKNSYRFIKQKERFVKDTHSANLIIRSSIFKEINGFNSAYYPGEDTKLCLDIITRHDNKILYDPDVVVYHHKRPIFKKYLIQNARFGFHRGYFSRVLPKTSRIWYFFMPSLFFIGIITGSICCFFYLVTQNYILKYISNTFLIVLCFYTFLAFINSAWILTKSKNPLISLISIPIPMFIHITYGVSFILGFFNKKDLDDTYGRI